MVVCVRADDWAQDYEVVGLVGGPNDTASWVIPAGADECLFPTITPNPHRRWVDDPPQVLDDTHLLRYRRDPVRKRFVFVGAL